MTLVALWRMDTGGRLEAGRLGEGHRTGPVEEAFWERQGLREELQVWDPGRIKCWGTEGSAEGRNAMGQARQASWAGLRVRLGCVSSVLPWLQLLRWP